MSQIWWCENIVEPPESSRHQLPFNLFQFFWQIAPFCNEATSKTENGCVLKMRRQLTNGCLGGGGEGIRINYRDVFCPIYMPLYVKDYSKTRGEGQRGDGVWSQETRGQRFWEGLQNEHNVNQPVINRELLFCPHLFHLSNFPFFSPSPLSPFPNSFPLLLLLLFFFSFFTPPPPLPIPSINYCGWNLIRLCGLACSGSLPLNKIGPLEF